MFQLQVSDRLVLRLLTEAHSTALFALISQNRPALREWLPWVDGTQNLDDTRRFIRYGLRQHARRNGMHAGLWYDFRLGGVISYNQIDYGKQMTEIGYWLGTEFQGQGLMTASCRAMTHYAFTQLGLETVEIRCAAQNQRSRRVPERLGYVILGTGAQLDWQSEQYIETVIYAMSAADWLAQEGDAHEGGSQRRW
jgi:ribosomal-protein-serine acetyltransferase